MNRFTESSNEAVITLPSILEGTAQVLYVINNEEGWQFLSGSAVKSPDAQVVALERVLSTDPTIAELGNLPDGWYAQRATPTSPWARAPYEAN